MQATRPCWLVDMGTTRCRVWLLDGGITRARGEGDFGVRDVGRGGAPSILREKLCALIAKIGEAYFRSLDHPDDRRPDLAIGAGMITSAQGLLNIPHVPAPAGARELALHMQEYRLSETPLLRLFLVPGVKTIAHGSGLNAALLSDIMRGEEVLCIGLLSTVQIRPGAVILNLGSHWKWIFTDSAGRIAKSQTSITGELIHVTQSQTLLAASLPQGRPSSLDRDWLSLGSEEYRRSGLTRALFCVRLLEQARQCTADERLSFLYGVFLEADLEALRKSALQDGKEEVHIVGTHALASAWCSRLAELNIDAHIVEDCQREQAYIAGLSKLLTLAEQEKRFVL